MYVVCHNTAEAFILARCDEQRAAALAFSNGDDGRCLARGTASAFTCIDWIGDFQGDPGQGFAVCGEAGMTNDRTIVRKSTVTRGSSWAASSDENACEWTIREEFDWSGLGRHVMHGFPYDEKTLHALLAIPRVSALNCANLVEVTRNPRLAAPPAMLTGGVVERINQMRSMRRLSASACDALAAKSHG